MNTITTGNTALLAQKSPAGAPVKSESAQVTVSTEDKAEIGAHHDSMGMTLLKDLGIAAKYAGKGLYYAGKGMAIGGYRIAKGFAKGMAKTQEGVLGKKAGILGAIALPASLGGAVAGGMAFGPAGAVVGAIVTPFWYQIGGGIAGAAKELVHPS
jgi:hypothetical protein